MSNDPALSPAVAEIISRIEKLDRADNSQLWMALFDRPDLRLDFLIVPQEYFPDARRLMNRLTVNATCNNARRTQPLNRRVAIDKLFDDGHLRSEIYEQMRLKHKELMKGRAKVKGEKKEFMDEDDMWTSYKAVGGCHPKSAKRPGRPKKNMRKCNNALRPKK
jgi:hypothetical protein